MEIFIIKALQFMLAISLLVLLHEGGHFFFAKLFGIRVEKFYLFFNPWFHLFEYKPRNSDTTYGLGWLPLGGYCKIAGMIDESFDTEQMKQPAQPWEFRSRPAWQRLLVMIGGVLVNFITALAIYAMILFVWGDSYVPAKDMTHGIKFNQEAKSMGFRDGDILIGTDKATFKQWGGDMIRDLSKAQRVDIIRDGKSMSVNITKELSMLEMVNSNPPFATPLLPNTVNTILPGSPAEKCGIVSGDKITSINGKAINSWNELTYETGQLAYSLSVTPADSINIRTVTITIDRAGKADTLKTMLTADLKLGITPLLLYDLYKPVTVEYGLFESIPAGAVYGVNVLKGYVDDMKYVFTSEGAKSIGGFGTIGNLFPASWDWYLFWKMTAFLSIILAFMNILPIPALDGGHVLFLLYEMIARRKPSEQFLIVAEYIGFGLLLLLLLYANINDILRMLNIF
ncbi:MAG: RIP metalloprotease RseP [Prevotellaceae bacterium]|nr:RIP metalloprotease RseP [Prevotella sp.]MDD6817881.1 RIP metalloprotease RseP [Prevotellaceae bacterium]MDD6842484.1 RIP metalloprotease RseP [Prevotellaceae bacterium]MDD7097016.1 RIP metalloprotease RseP [Prevotellaceae bacterium]MDY5004887.1 RIP metalloprotease RseP [Prevotella sp.]